MSQKSQMNNKEGLYYCHKCVKFKELDTEDIKHVGKNGKPLCNQHELDIEMERYG